jgi:hypothetical protein
LPLAELRKQLRDSRIYLEQLLGHAVELFAYPYGQLADFSSATSQILREESYKIAVTTRWGSSNSAACLLTLRRIFFNENDTTHDLRAKVEGEYDWLALKERIGFVLHPRRNQKARMRTEHKSRVAKATSIH